MFSYYGSKSKIARRYPRPQHSIIVEPFAGAAHYSVYHAIRGNIEKAILIEKNPRIAGVWRWLISASEDEIANLPIFKAGEFVSYPKNIHAQRFLRMQHHRGRSDGHERAGSFLKGRNERDAQASIMRVASSVKYIRNFEIIEGGYHLAPDIKATWFVDPPYQHAGGNSYAYGPDRIPYDDLARRVKQWRGLKIVCEGKDADWLPFRFFLRQQGGQSTAPAEYIYMGRRA